MRYEAAPLPVNLSLTSGQKVEEPTDVSQTLSDLTNGKIDSNLQQEVLKWGTAFSDTLISNRAKKKKK